MKTEQERAVHPEYYGKDYDELHGAVKKNIDLFLREWPKKKHTSDLNIAKAQKTGDATPSSRK